MKNPEKLEKIRDILTKLHSNIDQRKKEIAAQEESQSSSTMIPFYDLFYEQIKELMREEKLSFDKSEEPQLDGNSAMLTSVAGGLTNTGFIRKIFNC